MTSFFKKHTWIPGIKVLILLFCAAGLSANNIQIGAPTLTGENRTEGYVFVTFDLSWENSWRGTEANNWDAAWVFVKFRIGGGEWQHAKLHNTGHIAGTGTPATISAGLVNNSIPFGTTSNPAVGVFIYRNSIGLGEFNTTANKIRWNYIANGVINAATIEVRLFAIEMVYVPLGEYNTGGGGGGNEFISTTINTSDARITPSGSGNLGGQAGGYPTGQDMPAFSTWPNGYNSFYCMKYEVTQQQYVDFLNSLTPSQSINRVNLGVYNGYGSYGARYSVKGNNAGQFSTIHPFVACAYIKLSDGAAYAEWSGLRPLTEMEYEKACRGNQFPVLNEYAWGNDQVASQPYTVSNLNLHNENITSNFSTSKGNANIVSNFASNGSVLVGPLRVGIFASYGIGNGRVPTGSSYWGIMELTGNLLEPYLSLTEAYDGRHGVGLLDQNGNSTSFPLNYLVFKGGGFGHNAWPVSRRDLYPTNIWGRENGMGFRAGRSE